MGKESGYCSNDECLALINTFWGGSREPFLRGFRSDNQCLVPVKGGLEQEGTHRWRGRE